MEVPNSLLTWFKIHFIVDLLFALPLFLFPRYILTLFQLQTTDVGVARLVAAAFLAIGTTSFINNKANLETYKTLLNLKIIWSTTAILGLVLSLFLSNSPNSLWLAVGIFIIFSAVWIYYRITLQ